jgi:hypothetical protein
MPRFHHVNLGIPPGLEEAEGQFLVDILGYKKIDLPERLQGMALWYSADDGTEVHLSIDPDHRPAAMAHTALEPDEGIESRLEAAGVPYQTGGRDDLRILFCDDPAGNRWELRTQTA